MNNNNSVVQIVTGHRSKSFTFNNMKERMLLWYHARITHYLAGTVFFGVFRQSLFFYDPKVDFLV
jgi:hypothetical protein